MVHRDRKKMNLTLADETRESLSEIAEKMNMSISRVIDLVVEKFNKDSLPLVNYLRKKLGKKPLRK